MLALEPVTARHHEAEELNGPYYRKRFTFSCHNVTSLTTVTIASFLCCKFCAFNSDPSFVTTETLADGLTHVLKVMGLNAAEGKVQNRQNSAATNAASQLGLVAPHSAQRQLISANKLSQNILAAILSPRRLFEPRIIKPFYISHLSYISPS